MERTRDFSEILRFPIKVREGLLVDLLTEEMAPELHAQVNTNRDYLRKWLGWLDTSQSLEDTLNFIKGSLEAFRHSERADCGIFQKGKLVGAISLRVNDRVQGRGSLGYWLAEEAQGQGIVTAACRALFKVAFEDLQFREVEIRCATGNGKSRAIPERLGCEVSHTIQNAEWLYGHYVDHVVYVMTQRRWCHSLDA
jgi:ribosomal-protein-serine acetyltransferase